MDGSEKQEKLNKINKLAHDVLILSRNTLLVHMRFLDAALNQLKVREYEGTYALCGDYMFYDAKHVLESYKKEKEAPVRAYLHMVLHCIFQHMYGAPNLNQAIWNLACDIAVEYTIYELEIKAVEVKRTAKQEIIFEELKKYSGKLTAEKIYNYYLTQNMSDKELAMVRSFFLVDDHEAWYWTAAELLDVIERYVHYANNCEENEITNSCQMIDLNKVFAKNGTEQIWKSIAERMETDMETFSKRPGTKAGNLIQNLKEINREKYDYTEFLRKFAVMGEVMKANDEEFDYIFYTYGMELYDNMPLIEPLEYKEEKRIKEFVIAIDTSGSVSGDIVQTFVKKTYNILKSTESFFEKINLHIIQCDAEIQEDVKITTQEEFDTYIKTMELYGFGGTDFRPVFAKVNEMIAKKEFQNLKGLIYFTDGWGEFPEKMPDYNTAFVFIDDDYINPNVPGWAIKLVLKSEEI